MGTLSRNWDLLRRVAAEAVIKWLPPGVRRWTNSHFPGVNTWVWTKEDSVGRRNPSSGYFASLAYICMLPSARQRRRGDTAKGGAIRCCWA